MDFFPRLENERCLLRPLQPSDWEALYALAHGQPDLFRYMTSQLSEPERLKKFLERALFDRSLHKCTPFAIVDAGTGAVAGTTRFANWVPDHKRIEIGWTWLGVAFHGTGLNKAAKYLMLQYAFTKCDLNRVELKANALNLASRKAIEHMGGYYEGLFRRHMINEDGSLRDTVYYSFIREEWSSIKEKFFNKNT